MSIRKFIEGPLGKPLTIGATALAILVAVWAIWTTARPSAAVSQAGRSIYICSESGKSFEYKISSGEKLPVRSPHSSKQTGYPAELCYWTSDGKAADVATPVLMNSYIGKPEPTFCTDCGRLVRFRNPRPDEGAPPPTREGYSRNRDRDE